jgi:membrane-associated phospholipid phosphatase
LPAIWSFVTDFGDSAVTVPLALLVLVFLTAAGWHRLALGWALTIGGCAVGIAMLKLIFVACGSPLPIASIVSPSGHTAMSAAVYGSLALLIGARLAPRGRATLIVVAWLAIIGIALSRVALHEHTIAEVLVGLIVGAGAIMISRAILGREKPPPTLPLGWLMFAGIAVIAIMHGTRWAIEPRLHRLAADFRLALPWCR